MSAAAPSKGEVGRAGEAAALRFLERQRFKLLQQNLRLGRAGEIDLVMRERDVLVVVEVKSRIAGDTLGGLMNITATKQRKLITLAQLYLQKYGTLGGGLRFDAVEVEFADARLKRPSFKHIRDAFRA